MRRRVFFLVGKDKRSLRFLFFVNLKNTTTY